MRQPVKQQQGLCTRTEARLEAVLPKRQTAHHFGTSEHQDLLIFSFKTFYEIVLFRYRHRDDRDLGLKKSCWEMKALLLKFPNGTSFPPPPSFFFMHYHEVVKILLSETPS